MRDDYFTASELCSLLNIPLSRFHKLQQKKDGIPAKHIGDRWVCDKPKFFVWFHRIVNTGRLEEFFSGIHINVNAVWAERDAWLDRSAERAKHDMQVKLNRHYIIRRNMA